MVRKAGCGAGRKAQYLIYRTENRTKTNKALKFQRHLKKHPNDIDKGGL
jgi:hypothetical protein